jgi:hypothetical protein
VGLDQQQYDQVSQGNQEASGDLEQRQVVREDQYEPKEQEPHRRESPKELADSVVKFVTFVNALEVILVVFVLQQLSRLIRNHEDHGYAQNHHRQVEEREGQGEHKSPVVSNWLPNVERSENHHFDIEHEEHFQ